MSPLQYNTDYTRPGSESSEMLITFLRLEKKKKLNLSGEWNANWSIIPFSQEPMV